MTLNPGGIAMLDRNTAETIIYRTAVAALGYYADKHHEDPSYIIDEDIDWCIQPFGNLPWPHAQRIRQSIRDVITDPTTHRRQFTSDIMNLVNE